jgi:hypothetical protein
MKRLLLLAFCLVASDLGFCFLGSTAATAQEDRAQQGAQDGEAQQDGETQQGQTQPQAQPAADAEAAALTTKFDGTYSIDVTTQDGSCDNSHWTVVISHAIVTSVSPNPYNITASGGIEDDGTVSLSFRGRASDEAHVGGTVKGNGGKGAWSAPSLLCGGIWRAQKK